jgi:hypothetical protein
MLGFIFQINLHHKIRRLGCGFAFAERAEGITQQNLISIENVGFHSSTQPTISKYRLQRDTKAKFYHHQYENLTGQI